MGWWLPAVFVQEVELGLGVAAVDVGGEGGRDGHHGTVEIDILQRLAGFEF